jgi:anti-anti-sigma factor
MDAQEPGASLRLIPIVSGGVMSIHARGELDLATGPELENLIEASLQVPNVRSVVIDCARLTFVDAAGLGALLRSYWLLKDHDRALTYAGRTVRLPRPSYRPGSARSSAWS